MGGHETSLNRNGDILNYKNIHWEYKGTKIKDFKKIPNPDKYKKVVEKL